MKTVPNAFSLMIIIFLIGSNMDSAAQGRGNGHGHRKDHHSSRHGKYNDRCSYDYDQHYHHNGSRDYEYRRAPVERVVYHRAPRYVYYRDYDIYYDSHRSVYISFSGRNWMATASLPVVMQRVNIESAVRMDVDYYEDNFLQYLERRRPSYINIQAGW